jgi:hypothetical protein
LPRRLATEHTVATRAASGGFDGERELEAHVEGYASIADSARFSDA